jgi:hypothetical protein
VDGDGAELNDDRKDGRKIHAVRTKLYRQQRAFAVSGKATGWVLANYPVHDQGSRTAKLVLLSVADAMNQEGHAGRCSIADVCAEWGFERKTVMRHIATLVESGWLTVEEEARGRGGSRTFGLPGLSGIRSPGGTQSEAVIGSAGGTQSEAIRSHPEAEMGPNSDPLTFLSNNGSTVLPVAVPSTGKKPKPAREPRANEVVGRRVAQGVHDRKVPRPATPFVGIAQIAERLLDAGHSEDTVLRAMIAAPTITVAAVEFQIAMTRRSGNDPAALDGVKAWAEKNGATP